METIKIEDVPKDRLIDPKMEITRAENGYILDVDGMKYIYTSEARMSRAIREVMASGEMPEARCRRIRSFWMDKVGRHEKRILDMISEFPDISTKELVEHFLPLYQSPPATARFDIKKTLHNLRCKRFIEETYEDSQTWRTTNKMPTSQVTTAPKGRKSEIYEQMRNVEEE